MSTLLPPSRECDTESSPLWKKDRDLITNAAQNEPRIHEHRLRSASLQRPNQLRRSPHEALRTEHFCEDGCIDSFLGRACELEQQHPAGAGGPNNNVWTLCSCNNFWRKNHCRAKICQKLP